MEHQFKIGDRVRVIGLRPADWTKPPVLGRSMDEYVGEEGIVRALGGNVMVQFDDGISFAYKPSFLRFVPTEETPLLKVGDCITVLKGHHSEGATLIIERVDSNDPKLPYKAGGWWYSKDQVKLVESRAVESVRISTPCIDAIKSSLGAGAPKESVAKLPLISKTKLLTTIKLD